MTQTPDRSNGDKANDALNSDGQINLAKITRSLCYLTISAGKRAIGVLARCGVTSSFYSLRIEEFKTSVCTRRDSQFGSRMQFSRE